MSNKTNIKIVNDNNQETDSNNDQETDSNNDTDIKHHDSEIDVNDSKLTKLIKANDIYNYSNIEHYEGIEFYDRNGTPIELIENEKVVIKISIHNSVKYKQDLCWQGYDDSFVAYITNYARLGLFDGNGKVKCNYYREFYFWIPVDYIQIIKSTYLSNLYENTITSRCDVSCSVYDSLVGTLETIKKQTDRRDIIYNYLENHIDMIETYGGKFIFTI